MSFEPTNTYAYARYSWLLNDEDGFTNTELVNTFLDYCHYIANEDEKDSVRAGEKLLVFNASSRNDLRWKLIICGQDTGLKYAEIDLPVENAKQLDFGPFELLAANLRIALNGWDKTSASEKEAFLLLVDAFWKDLADEK